MLEADFRSIGYRCRQLQTLARSKGLSELFTTSLPQNRRLFRSLLSLMHILHTLSITLPISTFYESNTPGNIHVTNVLPQFVGLRKLELMIDNHSNGPQQGIALNWMLPVNLECLRIFYIPLWKAEFNQMANQQMINPIQSRWFPRLQELFVKRSCWRETGVGRPVELTKDETGAMAARLLDSGVSQLCPMEPPEGKDVVGL